jgi:hypothetical protein
MQPQVTFRGLAPSQTIVESVWKKAQKLAELEPALRGCHVVIEASSRSTSTRPSAYKVTVQLAGGTSASRRHARHAVDANVHTALRDAFRSARRQLDGRDKHARANGASAWRLDPLHA